MAQCRMAINFDTAEIKRCEALFLLQRVPESRKYPAIIVVHVPFAGVWRIGEEGNDTEVQRSRSAVVKAAYTLVHQCIGNVLVVGSM